MNKYPSIFNEVTGPEMRGPSSSHTAASWRIAKVALQIFNHPLRKALVEFDREGAWASNYREQGTAMGITGGLLGLDIKDDRMKETERLAGERGVEIDFRTASLPAEHPNTMRLTLEGTRGKRVQIIAVSTGGGAFEIRQIDDYPVNIRGDYYELLLSGGDYGSFPGEWEKQVSHGWKLDQCKGPEGILWNLKSSDPFTSEFIGKIAYPGISGDADRVFPEELILINPVLPVVSGKEKEMPWNSISSMLTYADQENLDLGTLGMLYEASCSGLPVHLLEEKMELIIGTIDRSIRKGLEGTIYEDRILHRQSHLLHRAEKEGRIPRSLVNEIIACVTAAMEAKSAMEVIVANPTAGSCGTVGGTLRALAAEWNSAPEEVVRAYFASGLIGAYFAMGPGFSAEELGCQVECGAASAMAAAGIAQLMTGTARQAVDAASLALQNMIGLVCDPVADRVEVPCLGKNISAAMNAFSSATMACSGFNAVIPFEEVLGTVELVGHQMPGCLKCTGKGGLAVTPTSNQIRDQLAADLIRKKGSSSGS